MTKGRWYIISSFVSVLIVLLAFFLFWRQSTTPLSEQAQEDTTAIDIGIVYLPITPSISTYYGLGVNSGALVTEVIAGSPADKAGIKVGDAILSFNGARVEDKVPLFGMMQSCQAGSRVTLEVWREKSSQNVEVVHTEK